MENKLSYLVDNLYEINEKECSKCMERKKIKSKCEFIRFKNDRLHYKRKECGKKCTKSINGLIKKFLCINQFCNGDLCKFVLLLRKGFYPYEYMDSWERSDETSLPDKKAVYSELNLKDITDKDYEHAQKVWEVFEIKNLGKYHQLPVESDNLLVAYAFKNFRDKTIKIYELNPAHFLSASRLACQVCLK